MDEMTLLLERLRPVIERIGGGNHDGEDLFGDVALACVENANRYDWLHPKIEGRIIRIAKHLRIRRFRRDRVRKHASLPADDCQTLGYEDGPLPEIQAGDFLRCQRAIDRLPTRFQRVVHEHFTNGKRFVTIANEMKLPSATIRTHCRRALQRLARDPSVRSLAPSNRLSIAPGSKTL